MALSSTASLQIGPDGGLRHLLTTEGLPRELIVRILDTAEQFVSVSEREVKKVPLLRGKSVFNLFFEPSTRTRTTFEIAAKRLSADVINLNITVSTATKGESLLDTVANLSAMQADIFVVRHNSSGAPFLIARHVKPHEHVINAGDGRVHLGLERRLVLVAGLAQPRGEVDEARRQHQAFRVDDTVGLR